MANSYTRRINLYINGKEVKNNIGSIQSEMRKLINEQNRMTIGSKEYNDQFKKIGRLKQIADKHRAEIRDIGKSWTTIAAEKINKYWGIVTAGVASLAGVAIAYKRASEAADNFQERIDNLSALTGLQGQELEWLGNAAKDMSVKITEGGVRIKQSADDIVDAFTKVGSQRPELLKNKEALAAVTEDAIILSEAAKMELAPAVAGLTTTMNQFNLPASESRRIINAMAAGSKEGAADIPYLTEAVEKSGTTMNLMNVSLEENIGLIEAIAPNYAKASLAGNSLDKVFLKLKEKQIGYVDGTFSVNDALEELEQRYKSGESAASIFGVEHAKMGELLVQNRAEFNRYTKAVTGTDIAIQQAATNTSNAKAIQAQARNEFHNAAIEIGKNLSPAMTELYRLAGSVATAFTRLIATSPADSLRKEQIEVNNLASRLTDTNLKEGERLKILSRLKEINPDIITGLSDENIEIEKLKTNLQLYNEEMAKRIVLANLESDEEKIIARQARALQQKGEIALNLRDKITNINSDIAISEGTIQEKYEKTKEYLEDILTTMEGDERTKAFSEEALQLASLNDTWINLTNATDTYNELSSKGTDFSKRIDALKEELGIQEKINESKDPEPDPDDDPDPNVVPTNYDVALAALDAANQERMDRLVIQYEQEAWTDQQYKAQQLVAEMAYLETKKALQQQYGENTLGTEAALSRKRVEAQKEINELLAEGDKELFDEIAADSKVVDEAAQATIDTADAAIKSLENSATKEQQIMQQREQTYLQFAQMVGQSFGELLADSEATFGDYLKNTLLMALEAFHQWFIIEKAKAIIEGISGGPFKIAAAIAKVAAMEIAYQGVKAVITSSMGSKKKPKGYAAGGFTDGDRIYRAGEEGEEWIAPNSFVRHPVFGPVIQALESFRARPNQVSKLAIAATSPGTNTRSVGSTTAAASVGTPNPTQPYTSDPELKQMLVAVYGLFSELKEKGIKASINKYGTNGLDEEIRNIEKFNTKVFKP